MIVLGVDNIRKHFGPDPVLDGVTFAIYPGDRIALVGPNGSGKTTLLRIFAGLQDPDGGSFQLHPSIRIGYLEQRPMFEAGRTLWAEARGSLKELISLQHEAVQVAHALGQTSHEAERRRLAARYDHLQQELHRQDAYNLDHKIERVLEGLRFTPQVYQQTVESLSGGEQNRLMLAKLLLADPGLMLLDEPSNHLDIDATQWLEEFLAASRSAMIVVSHDRYFLDKVANRTLELFHGTVDDYTGNYSAYLRQKQERLLVERRGYEKQQIEIEKTKEFIRRNAYGQKHAQAEDRKKKLDRLELISPPREINPPPMGFPPAPRTGDIVLRVEEIAKAYDRPLFENLSLDVLRGQRWAILGPNGTGKTTLLRCLVGQLAPDRGRVDVGHGVHIGYFDQHLKALDDRDRVVDAVRPEKVDFDEPKRRDLLARFGISGDTALQRVASLSGGERCRAAMARLAATEANVLVLDEPTNHLDLWALEALEKSLRKFDGTVLFVSHDRYFINQVADHLVVVEPLRFRVVEGNYATYQHLVSRGLAGEGAAAMTPTEAASDTIGPKVMVSEDATPQRRPRRFPYRKVADLEQDIFAEETRVEELHAALADPDTHRNGQRVRQIKTEIAAAQEALKVLYEHWEEAVELNW